MTKHEILVPWENQDTIWWNETCAMVLEFFGSPGHRYAYTSHVDYMAFTFEDEQDLTLCKLLLAGRY